MSNIVCVTRTQELVFHGERISCVLSTNGDIGVDMTRICNILGLNVSDELNYIDEQRPEWIKKGHVWTTLDNGTRSFHGYWIRQPRLAMWLGNISNSRIAHHKRPFMEACREELDDFVERAINGGAVCKSIVHDEWGEVGVVPSDDVELALESALENRRKLRQQGERIDALERKVEEADALAAAVNILSMSSNPDFRRIAEHISGNGVLQLIGHKPDGLRIHVTQVWEQLGYPKSAIKDGGKALGKTISDVHLEVHGKRPKAMGKRGVQYTDQDVRIEPCGYTEKDRAIVEEGCHRYAKRQNIKLRR